MAAESPMGFATIFSANDHVYDGHPDNYHPDSHAVWEYDAGGRGSSDWRRYLVRIETSLESMSAMGYEMGGSPNFLYCPGKPDNDGMCESGRRSAKPPSSVATCHVTFDDMTEREIYTGASRAVPRNEKRELAPASDAMGM